MRMWAAAAALALVVAAIILVRMLGSDEAVPVDETTLARSVERVIGGGAEADPERCRRGRRFQFRCAVSGGALYRVTLRRGGCWEAVRFAPAGGRERLPRRASGCVTEADGRR